MNCLIKIRVLSIDDLLLLGLNLRTRRHSLIKLLGNHGEATLIWVLQIRVQHVLCLDFGIQSEHLPGVDDVMVGNALHLRNTVNQVLHARILVRCALVLQNERARLLLVKVGPEAGEHGHHQHYDWFCRHVLHHADEVTVVLHKLVLGVVLQHLVHATKSKDCHVRQRFVELFSAAVMVERLVRDTFRNGSRRHTVIQHRVLGRLIFFLQHLVEVVRVAPQPNNHTVIPISHEPLQWRALLQLPVCAAAPPSNRVARKGNPHLAHGQIAHVVLVQAAFVYVVGAALPDTLLIAPVTQFNSHRAQLSYR